MTEDGKERDLQRLFALESLQNFLNKENMVFLLLVSLPLFCDNKITIHHAIFFYFVYYYSYYYIRIIIKYTFNGRKKIKGERKSPFLLQKNMKRLFFNYFYLHITSLLHRDDIWHRDSISIQASNTKMKVKVIVLVDQISASDESTPLIYVISVGTGNKTVKWLSLVTAQRYALTAPNGTIRRREISRASTIERYYYNNPRVLLQCVLVSMYQLLCDFLMGPP